MNAAMTAQWAAVAVWFGLAAFVKKDETFRLIPIGLASLFTAVAVMCGSGEWAR